MPWQPPSLAVNWGPYRAPDPEEQKAAIDGVMTLLGGAGAAGSTTGTKIITRAMALEKLQSEGVLDFESVEAVLEALDEEQEEADEKAREDAKNALADAAAIEVDTAKKMPKPSRAPAPGA